eukprot:gene19025-22745_t
MGYALNDVRLKLYSRPTREDTEDHGEREGDEEATMTPDFSCIALLQLEEAVKTFLYIILEAVLEALCQIEGGANCISVEAVEDAIRRSLPSSVCRPVLEQCLMQQRAHQLALHGMQCTSRDSTPMLSPSHLDDRQMGLMAPPQAVPAEEGPGRSEPVGITVRPSAQGMEPQKVWLWMPSDRDGSRQALQVKLLAGKTVESLDVLATLSFRSHEDVRDAFSPAEDLSIEGDLLLSSVWLASDLGLWFLVEETSFLEMLEYRLAVDGCEPDGLMGAGMPGPMLWRMFCLLVLQVGVAGDQLQHRCIEAVQHSAWVILKCAMDQIPFVTVEGHQTPSRSPVVGTACIKQLEVSSAADGMDALLDLLSDEAWEPQDNHPHITIYVAA